MTRYLLDTTTLIDISRQLEPARSRVRAHLDAGDTVGVCAVIVAEFASGLPPWQRGTWASLAPRLRYWSTTSAAAEHAGEYRYAFARQGIQIPTTDALVAATAWYWNATVVTDNLKHFPMPDIQVVSFRI